MRWTTGSNPAEASDADFDDLFRSIWPRAVSTARRIVGPGGCVEEDIAASMKISPGSVKTHLKRGLERLRAQDGNDPEASPALTL